MATMSFTIVTGGNTYTRSKTLSDVNALRVRDAMRIVHNLPGGTTQQVVDAVANGVFNYIESLVVQTEADVQKPPAPPGLSLT